MPTRIITFEKALQNSQNAKYRRLLLGNGFSIACRPDIFVYGQLFEKADFTELSPSARKAFEVLKTSDFEKVIRALRSAAKLIKAYEGDYSSIRKQMTEDAIGLREVLVKAIASGHPAYPAEISDAEYSNCQAFLGNFESVYSLNYDLLLYWAFMHNSSSKSFESDDGFRKPEENYDADYVVWESSQSHDQGLWYLHGALHVFDTGTEIQKYTWCNTGIRLIDQIRDALERNYFPLFVAEGTSREKLERIRHSDYLSKAFRSLESIGGDLFIYGHSLGLSDEHVLQCIEKSKVANVYIGIFGDPNTDENRQTILRARKMTSNRRNRKYPLEVHYFDSSSAQVWR